MPTFSRASPTLPSNFEGACPLEFSAPLRVQLLLLAPVLAVSSSMALLLAF